MSDFKTVYHDEREKKATKLFRGIYSYSRGFKL